MTLCRYCGKKIEEGSSCCDVCVKFALKEAIEERNFLIKEALTKVTSDIKRWTEEIIKLEKELINHG